MKTTPPVCPEPENGRRYWRSLDQLSETPEFRQWLEREFPEGASEWTDPVSRRHFVKIMSASFLLAGLGLAGTGCRRPEQRILPFSKMPENYVHGVPEFYATSMPTRTVGIPLVGRSNDGRPTKVDGNSLHPESKGGTDRFAQASILNLYDPDRATRFLKDGATARPEAAIDFLSSLSRELQGTKGKGVAFLMEPVSSLSRARVQQAAAKALPQAKWYAYDPLNLDIHEKAASRAFGRPIKPVFRYDAARVIVSLDCDFLGSEDAVHLNISRFSQGRRLTQPSDEMNRLYVVEPLLSLTGFSADHRMRTPASVVAQIAAALAAEVSRQAGNQSIPVPAASLPEGVDPKWIASCARDLAQHRGASLVVAGHRQPMVVHLLAHAMNAALGNVGKTVLLQQAAEPAEQGIVELAKSIQAGEVQTLFILGANPAYNAPADLNWKALQAKAGRVIRLGYYEDETSANCHWHLPMAHYLESWGDTLAQDGSLLPIQPLISPLFGGLTEIEVLARVAGLNATSPYDITRETFAQMSKGEANLEEAWKKFLHDGFLANSARQPVQAAFKPDALKEAMQQAKIPLPSKDQLEIIFHRDYSLDDGRYNNNGWLQELPDPVTKIVWDNVVLMSRKTAEALNLQNGVLVDVQVNGRTVRGPAWIQPGQADYTLAVALGYGRDKSGRVGHKVGFNAYAVRTSTAMHFAPGATIKVAGGTYPISCTQDHWALEGRPIVREANLSQYREHPDFAKRMNMQEPPTNQSLYPNPLDKVKDKALHQWAMSIDLNLCVGCSACVLACQSENNVPIVGKDQVKRGREMHWLRIDRYYAGNPAERNFTSPYKIEGKQQFESWVDDPQVLTQPMLCQHCEAAPCESVCPVNATVHDHEGLNVMVYNRCVGTRYCSNNCPYKVRRFNYFDYNKRPINALYKGPLATRPDDEWDLIKMIKNPDVTVRMRGVMEKCTFCVQRIESAKIAQKVKAGASGDVMVPADSFTTACAQACPSGAIVFGNLSDPQSRVTQLKKSERDYSVLEFLLTKPRLTYMARVRNPNPEMPDYAEAPLSFQDYEKHMGNPFKHSGTGHEGLGHQTAPAAHGTEKGVH